MTNYTGVIYDVGERVVLQTDRSFAGVRIPANTRATVVAVRVVRSRNKAARWIMRLSFDGFTGTTNLGTPGVGPKVADSILRKLSPIERLAETA